MISKAISFFTLLFVALKIFSQNVQQLTSGEKTSIRGMCVVSDRVVWVSGSGGKVGRSTDGGKTWRWMTVAGFEKREFRDIEAFDSSTAITMAIAEPAHILKTTDGGQTWKIVFTDTAKGAFLDAMDFAGNNGVVVGDPLPGTNRIYLAFTNDRGDSWTQVNNTSGNLPAVQTGEAMFAASGSNVVLFKGGKAAQRSFYIVTGGAESNLLSSAGVKIRLPIVQGKETAGANSIAAWNNKKFVVVGGDFANDKDSTQNCILTADGGKTFRSPSIPPKGYRSCVIFISSRKLLACGTTGVDMSADGGLTWQLISTEGFHVCRKAKKGKTVFLAGSNGKIAKLQW